MWARSLPLASLALVLSLRLHHLQQQHGHLDTIRVALAPPGHGKGPVDGEFGKLKAARSAVATKKWVNDLPTYVDELNAVFDGQLDAAPVRPARRCLAFTPLAKAELVL